MHPDAQPWHADKDDEALSRTFHAHAQAAGIATLKFMDLRGTAVVTLAAAGLEVARIASSTGRTLRSAHDILGRYGARNRAVARAASTRRRGASLQTATAGRKSEA